MNDAMEKAFAVLEEEGCIVEQMDPSGGGSTRYLVIIPKEETDDPS